MGNSKERRKLQRLLAEAGLSSQAAAPSHPRATTAERQAPLLRKALRRIYTLLGLAALLVTLFSIYPWLSVDVAGSLDPSNPIKAEFFVANEGLVPISKATVICTPTLDAENGVVHGPSILFDNAIESLHYKHRASLPCYRSIGGRIGKANSATMKIVVSYKFQGFFPHMSQEFNFVATKAADNTLHWMYRD